MKIWTFKGVPLTGFWTKIKRNLVGPHIVPRGTANNMHKIRKKCKIDPPYSLCIPKILLRFASECTGVWVNTVRRTVRFLVAKALNFKIRKNLCPRCIFRVCVAPFARVGHSVLFRSVRYVLFHSKKRMFRSFPFFSVLFRSFLEFLATYETQKNVPFF